MLSPKNPKLREFLEKSAFPHPWGSGQNTKPLYEAFMRGEGLPKFGETGSIDNWFGAGIREGHREEGKQTIPYSWTDIADCIVDLRSGTRWTREYSEEEKAAAEQDMAAYRRGEKQVPTKPE